MSGVHRFKVGAWNITLKFVKDLYKDEGHYGDWEKDKQIIQVALDQPENIQAATLIHELFHAASDYSHLGFNERTVVALENFFVELLRDNKDVVKRVIDFL